MTGYLADLRRAKKVTASARPDMANSRNTEVGESKTLAMTSATKQNTTAPTISGTGGRFAGVGIRSDYRAIIRPRSLTPSGGESHVATPSAQFGS